MKNTLTDSIESALAIAVSEEEDRLHKIYDDFDDEHLKRVKKLSPLLLALSELKEQTADYEGCEISIAQKGHMASIKLTSSTNSERLTISTNYDGFDMSGNSAHDANSFFTIERFSHWSIDGSNHESKKSYKSMKDVLEIVVKEVGKHKAQQNVLEKRKVK